MDKMKFDDGQVKNYYVPTIIERSNGVERVYDIFTKLLDSNIIFLNGEVNEVSAQFIIGQMLYLESRDRTKDIQFYINSPGGSVTDGLAIYDTMKYIANDVSTICVGLAASMGAFLLSSGTKGKRYALPHAEIMIHQVLGGYGGQATDVEIHTRHLLRMKDTLNKILSENCSQPYEKVVQDTERDNFMTAEEALNYGLIDKIMESRNNG